jgi:hypothetical protein
MSEFDPVRATRDEVTALSHIQSLLQNRINKAEDTFHAAEAELLELRKLEGFTRIMLEVARNRLESFT